jgi:hypothetical protein
MIIWQESGLLEQVLDEHPYPYHIYCIKIRASSFCSPLKKILIFVSLTPHIVWTKKFADHLNKTIGMWKKYFVFFMSLSIDVFQEFSLKFKIAQKNSELIFLYSICYF